MPQLVDSGAAYDKEASDVPAAVSDGVVERGADRSARCLEIGAAVDQCRRDIDVVAARGPVQRRFAWLQG